MTQAAPYTLAYATLAQVSGATLRQCDRVLRDGKPGVWFGCVVNGKRTEVRLAMKSGRVVAFRQP